MARETMPINPVVLAWARVRAGYTVDDVGERVKALSNIGAWEAGERQPTYPQLEKLADEFQVPVAVFFFPNPPDLPAIEETFRTIGSKQLGVIPPRIRLLLRWARAFQISLEELYGRNSAQRLITRDASYDFDSDVSAIARDARDRLGIPIERQLSWQDPDVALREWRKALFDVGVYVFKDQFREREFSGFCLHHVEFPIIYVNNNNSKTRQIFTMFHELAHLLFHTSGVHRVEESDAEDLPITQQWMETICNRFASQLLVPDKTFTEALNGGEATEVVVAKLAKLFVVSREVIYRRFHDHQLIAREEFQNATMRLNERKKKKSGGGNYYHTKIAYLGDEYITRAFEAFHQGRIDEERLADYLDTPLRNVAKLEDHFLRRSV